MHLVFGLILAIMGSICMSYHAKNYDEKVFSPLPIYTGFLFMLAGAEIAKFAG